MLPARLSPLLLTSYSANSLFLEDGLISQSPAILLLLTTTLLASALVPVDKKKNKN